jgi:hypothetical protein
MSMLLCLAATSAAAALPSLCSQGEVTILSARLAPGRLLSLCADREEEPYGSFGVRVGEPSAIELESYASEQTRFVLSYDTTHNNVNAEVVWFNQRNNTYCVSVGIIMARGVTFAAYDEKGKLLYSQFSGTEEGRDFIRGPDIATFGVRRPISPLFAWSSPRPCGS